MEIKSLVMDAQVIVGSRVVVTTVSIRVRLVMMGTKTKAMGARTFANWRFAVMDIVAWTVRRDSKVLRRVMTAMRATTMAVPLLAR